MTEVETNYDANPFVANRAALLSALQSVGVTHVEVTFDGGGDSGCVQDVQYTWLGNDRTEHTDHTLDEIQVAWNVSQGHKHNPTTNQWERQYAQKDIPLRHVVESFTYELLSQAHGGWENNEGAYGTLSIDVLDQTINLVFNARYTEVTTTEEAY